MKFGLSFFGSGENTTLEDKYSLVIESAKLADKHSFSSIWLPERHFASLGCLYPNPAILHAALARETAQIRLQAGSVVLPLHNPLSIAEDWAVVDNLSRGRIGVSFASGWNPNDFAFFPEKYNCRYEEMYSGIKIVKKLWKGESVQVTNGVGKQVEVRIYPTPIQKNLPIWITAASNPQTYMKAGEIGANLLTHMLSQSIEELTKNVTIYREALVRNGHDPEVGQVTLMLHTFVGENLDSTREEARKPFCEYLKSNGSLLNQLAQSRGRQIDFASLSQVEIDEFTNFLYERFSSKRALIGTPESCVSLVEELHKIGINEITCLLDFGLSDKLILEHLLNINQLKEHYQSKFLLKNGISEIDLYREKPNRNHILKSQESGEIKFKPGVNTLKQNLQYLQKLKTHFSEEIAGVDLYQSLSEFGAEHGSTFQCVKHVYLKNEEALGEISLPEEFSSQANSNKFRPVLLHNCFLVLGTTASKDILKTSKQSFVLPIGMEGLEIYKSMSNKLWSYAIRKTDSNSENLIEGDLYIINESGELIAKSWGLKFKIVDLTSSHNNSVLPQAESYDAKIQNPILRDKKGYPIKDILLEAPLTEHWSIIEDYLCKQVSKVLGLSSINKVDSQEQLLNLGFNSLMAIELRNQIESDLGVIVSVVKFLENPKINQLVEHIVSSLNLATNVSESVSEVNHPNHAVKSWSPLVEIKGYGNQTPFFCIHPIDGNILCYRDLAKYIGSDQPLFGLQSPLFKGLEKPLETIEDMATYYIKYLRIAQPEGPYMIGGWSLGGIIAYEMAQQLSSQGYEIALLSLIDSHAPTLLNQVIIDNSKTDKKTNGISVLAEEKIDDITLINYFIKGFGSSHSEDFSLSINEQENFELNEQLDSILEKAKVANILPLGLETQKLHKMFDVFKINFLARYRYVPQPYSGSMTLFRAQEQLSENIKDSTLGWEKLVLGGVDVYDISGDHSSIIREPSVQDLAKYLRKCLTNPLLMQKCQT